MILLLDGATHTGKTAFAQYLMEKYRYPYLCLDHIKMGLIRSGKVDFTAEEDEKITEYMWPIITGIVKTAIENEQNMIVEGCYFPEEWLSDFTLEEMTQIRYLCLVMSEDYIRKNYQSILNHADVIEKRKQDDGISMEYLIEENQKMYQKCITHDYECYVINDTYHIDYSF